MVTTVTDNSPQSINTSLFSLDKEVQEIKKVTDKLAGINTESGVISVNGKQGIVELTASDVNALPSSTVIPTTTSELENTSGFITASSDITGNAATATTAKKVANALTVNGKTYDGSSAVDAGVQTVANGGTGVTTQADINKAFIGNLEAGESDVTDGTEFVSSYASDNSFSEPGYVNTPLRRKFSAVWNYIKGKISSVLGLTKDNYGGKASTAGTADSATTAGTATTAAKLGRNGNTGIPMTFNWSGQGGQPSWLWGGEDGSNMYVYNPSNFSVNRASTAGTADKTVNDISIDIPYVSENGQYVIPFGNILEPTSTAVESPYNWDITGFFSIIRPSGHSGSHIKFEAGHGYSHDWTTYAYLDKEDFGYLTSSIKAFQYNGKWWLGLCIITSHQGYTSKMTITYSRGLPATPTCILYYSRSNGVANQEIYNSIQDIPSSWWRQRTICNPTTFTQNITAPNITSLEQRVSALESRI